MEACLHVRIRLARDDDKGCGGVRTRRPGHFRENMRAVLGGLIRGPLEAE